jgi:hypothetical protein
VCRVRPRFRCRTRHVKFIALITARSGWPLADCDVFDRFAGCQDRVEVVDAGGEGAQQSPEGRLVLGAQAGQQVLLGVSEASVEVGEDLPAVSGGDLLTDALLSHLSYEEHQILEPLARLGPAIYG